VLLAYYKFDNSAADSSGNGKTLTPGGTATYVAPGKVGTHAGIQDGGNGNFFSAPIGLGIDNVAAMSWGGWFYFNTRADNEMLLAHGNGISSRIEVYLGPAGSGDNTAVVFELVTSANVSLRGVAPACVPLNGTWYHVWCNLNLAGATDAEKMQIYVNRVNQTLTFTTGSSGAPTATPDLAAGSTSIGRRHYNTSLYMDGQYDEIRMYNNVLTAAEVGAVASTGNPPLYADMGLYGDMALYE